MTECDNKSVGVIIENANKEILLIERARFPFGYAAPAGHIDEHGSAEQTAVEEVYEETGLCVVTNSLQRVLGPRRIENRCRRPGGMYHDWEVFYTTDFTGNLKPSHDETNGAQWFSQARLQELADVTRSAVPGILGLEAVWLTFFEELGYVD